MPQYASLVLFIVIASVRLGKIACCLQHVALIAILTHLSSFQVYVRGSIYFTQNKEGGDGVYQTLTVFSTQNTNGENLLKMVIFSNITREKMDISRRGKEINGIGKNIFSRGKNPKVTLFYTNNHHHTFLGFFPDPPWIDVKYPC